MRVAIVARAVIPTSGRNLGIAKRFLLMVGMTRVILAPILFAQTGWIKMRHVGQFVIAVTLLLVMLASFVATSDAQTYLNWNCPDDIWAGPMSNGTVGFAYTPNPSLPWSYSIGASLAVPIDAWGKGRTNVAEGRGFIHVDSYAGQRWMKMHPYFGDDAIVAWQNSTHHEKKP